MNVMTAPLMELGEFDEIKRKLERQSRVCASLTGCMESQKLHMVYGLGEGFKNRLIVTFSDLRVKEMMEDYRFYDRTVTSYPARDLIFYQADVHQGRWGKSQVNSHVSAMLMFFFKHHDVPYGFSILFHYLSHGKGCYWNTVSLEAHDKIASAMASSSTIT